MVLDLNGVTLFRIFIFFGLLNYDKVEQEIPVRGYKLIWNDEFNGNELDKTKWRHRGLGKRDDAYITRRSSRLNENGFLVIEAKQSGDSITTGMITTEDIFEPLYGYFECRARPATTSGTISAFWLQSHLIHRELGSPEINGAELDIFECFPHISKDSVAHTLHWGGYGANHKVVGPFWAILKKTNDGFHTFGLEWTPESYNTFVDGVKTTSGNSLISKVPEFIVLSLLADKTSAGQLDVKRLPDQFLVDYIRVYRKN
jgi:beta-glucanase (GH16 family)